MQKDRAEIERFLQRMTQYHARIPIPLIPRPERDRWLDELGFVDKDVNRAIANGIKSEDFYQCVEVYNKCEEYCECLLTQRYSDIVACKKRQECGNKCGCIATAKSEFVGGCLWEFGIVWEGKKVYIKLHEFDNNFKNSFKCISFHKPKRKMQFVYKTEVFHV
jgi:hypothetical protein